MAGPSSLSARFPADACAAAATLTPLSSKTFLACIQTEALKPGHKLAASNAGLVIDGLF